LLTHSFAALGPRIDSQELLELALAGDRWYKAENSQDVRAVIGFVRGEKVDPEEKKGPPKKRVRID
jgi:hypothetical protein